MKKQDKTARVLIETANAILAGAASTADERMCLIALTDAVLLERGMYHGYRYLNEHEVNGQGLPGIRFIDGEPVFNNTDPSRRAYL